MYEANLREARAGFRKGRGCTDQIFTLRQIFERRIRHGKPFDCIFVDFSAAFDAAALYGHPWLLLVYHLNLHINVLNALCDDSNICVRVYGDYSRKFQVKTGIKQGCIVPSCLFNSILDWLLAKAMSDCNGILVSNDYLKVTDLGYAGHPYLGETEEDLQNFFNILHTFESMIGLEISIKKTKMMSNLPATLSLNNNVIKKSIHSSMLVLHL